MKTWVCLHSCGSEGSSSSWRHRACQLGPRVNTLYLLECLRWKLSDKRSISRYQTGFLTSAASFPPPPQFLVSSTHIYDSELLYGQNILSVCPCESICKRVSPCLSAAFVQPTGKGPRLPEVYCVISRLGCFDLFSTVSSVRLIHENAPYVSKLSHMEWLQQTCCWMSVQARKLNLYFANFWPGWQVNLSGASTQQIIHSDVVTV